MLSLEVAIQKIQQFPPEQRNQVIQFVEFLDYTSSQSLTPNAQPPAAAPPDAEGAFFELAGMWENQDITATSLRAEAWRETK
jgi:hypothetical protein